MLGRDLKTMTHVPYVFSRVFSHSHCYYCYPLRTSVFFCVWEFLLAKTIFAKWLLSCQFQPNQNCINFVYLIKHKQNSVCSKMVEDLLELLVALNSGFIGDWADRVNCFTSFRVFCEWNLGLRNTPNTLKSFHTHY